MSFQYLNSVETQLMSIDVIIESLGQVATARLLITHICTPRRGGGMGSRHGRFFFSPIRFLVQTKWAYSAGSETASQ